MKNIKKIYFIGIGGISMCALAHLLKNSGYNVLGSDIDKNQVEMLKNKGFQVYYGHNQNNITKDIDLVVTSASIDKNNPEIVRASMLGIKIINRGQLLYFISKKYKNVIAISGSHGKTTTTAMIFEIFQRAGLNPTCHIGGIVRSISSNIFDGDKNFFITEACEFHDNFLYLKPNLSVITNVEPEHMEYFKTKKRLYNSFKQFAKNSDNLVTKLKLKHQNKIIIGKTGYYAQNLVLNNNGCYKFDMCFKNKVLFSVNMKVFGKYNVENAVMACACAKHYNISNYIIKNALENFEGVERRFDIICNRPKIIHDYAHHPSELKAVIDATKLWTFGKLIAVFQPHTYSRTKTLMPQFLNCFNCCDMLLIIKTYSARENELVGGRAFDLYNNIKNTGKFNKRIFYFDDFESAYMYLKSIIKDDDNVLFLGAGNINNLAYMFKNKQND